MRPIEELINITDPGWVFVSEWIDSAKNLVEILPCDSVKAREALYNTQVTSRSPMGAVILMTGGILIDNGWIRILGSGSTKLQRSLPEWNKGKAFQQFGQDVPFLLIGDDAIGGFFFLNGGEFGEDMGKVYYLAPDNLEYEPLEITYTEFLLFCFNNDLDSFYQGLRWSTWKDDVSKLGGDNVFNFYPPLFTAYDDINTVSRKIIPVIEQYNVNLSIRRQLRLDS